MSRCRQSFQWETSFGWLGPNPLILIAAVLLHGEADCVESQVFGMAWGNAASQGFPIARTLNELLAIIRSLG